MPSQIQNSNPKNKIPDQVFSPIYGVKLTGGLFQKVFHNNIDYLKKIDLDAALYWFRKKAGKEAPGSPYRGHFEDNLHGQTAGLLLMGAGNALRWTDDEELRALTDTIVKEIKDCSEPDGYLMAIPKEQFGTLEYPHYVRVWLTYGLAAAALSGNRDAYPMIRKFLDWFNQCDDLPILKYLGLAFQGVVCNPFCYNTPIGKWEDIETTIAYYEEDWRLGQFIMRDEDAVYVRRQPGYEPHTHGTEIEALEGYLDLYRATGKHYYLRAVENAYRMYQRYWQHVGGGIAMCEFLENIHNDSAPLLPPKPYNELCCTAFWIWLNQRLHRLFPDNELYVSEIERSLYNIAVANQDGNEGIRYFAWIDHHKMKGGAVHCCCGVGTRIFGMLPEFLYSVGDEELLFNIYAASTFTWEREAGAVTVITETDMPYHNDVTVRIHTDVIKPFALKLRIPSWTKGEVLVSVDGEETFSGTPGKYLIIERDWSGTHTISFALPFAWKQTLYTGDDQVKDFRTEPEALYKRYALEYGPLLMAVRISKQRSVKLGHDHYIPPILSGLSAKAFMSWLTPTKEPLAFIIGGFDDFTLVPYFQIETEDEFTCYPCYDTE